MGGNGGDSGVPQPFGGLVGLAGWMDRMPCRAALPLQRWGGAAGGLGEGAVVELLSNTFYRCPSATAFITSSVGRLGVWAPCKTAKLLLQCQCEQEEMRRHCVATCRGAVLTADGYPLLSIYPLLLLRF